MIKIEDVEVMGIRKAIKGMRNPLNSWDKSDSGPCLILIDGMFCDDHCDFCKGFYCATNGFVIGDDNDLPLAKKLVKSGSDHRKFMRMIHVQADVTAPLYWWKEYDTYKVGTVANSCSTMHKIHEKEFEFDDFSHDRLTMTDDGWVTDSNGLKWCDPLTTLETLRNTLNACRDMYLKTKDKKWWWQIIQLLPSSYNQLRTIDLNYEVLYSIYHQRKTHKLDEWSGEKGFCSWIKTLPYMKDFLGLEDKDERYP